MNWGRGEWDQSADALEDTAIFPLFSNIYHTFQEFPTTGPYSSINVYKFSSN